MEISSVNKFFTRLVVRWLKSDFRSAMLRSTYIQCPRWFGKKPSLKIFLSFDDPYSYLLIQLLQRIQHNLPIPIKLMMVSESLPNENIGGSQWRDWALHDSAQLAEKLQLLAIQKKPTIKAVITAQQLWQFQPKTIDNAASLFNTLWQQSFEYNYPQSTPVINSLIKNQQYLLKQGFYLPASIYFAGGALTDYLSCLRHYGSRN